MANAFFRGCYAELELPGRRRDDYVLRLFSLQAQGGHVVFEQALAKERVEGNLPETRSGS